MCGILAIIGLSNPSDHRKRALRLSKLLRHRGPDWSGVHITDNSVLCHERLAIVDVISGSQPLHSFDGTVSLVINGEIYNHKDLRENHLKKDHKTLTNSDCEIIISLYQEHKSPAFIDKLRGDFGFVLYDKETGEHLAARDPIGVFPLYIGKCSQDGSVYISSEMKALQKDCDEINVFPPGHYWSSKDEKFVQYYNPGFYRPEFVPAKELDHSVLRNALDDAVKKRLMTDVPYGVLLSGGLDSSLIASLVSRHVEKRVEDEEKTKAWFPRLHSFSIGLAKESPDLKMAKKVADFLGTVHHEFTFTIQDGLDALETVIYHLETFDVTTIRASTPMFLLARKIKATGVKMCLSGEGADEVFGGYLYFHHAKDKEQFHKECVSRVSLLHTSDCLRANKSMSAFGVEVRVPFLDRDFLDVAFSFDPKEKLCGSDRMEKFCLRKSFDTKESPYLPDEILWRQKEQFSDGVGYSFIDTLILEANKNVTDGEFAKRDERFPVSTPQTKEAYYYRTIFEGMFPSEQAAKTCVSWIPKWGKSTDPSGRAQSVHVKHDHQL